MNKTMIAASIAALVATSAVTAATTNTATKDGLYFSGALGTTLKSDLSDEGVDFEFNPGYRASVAVGRKMDQFRVEGELAFMHNRTDKIKFNGMNTGIDEDIDTAALFLNGYYDIDTATAFTPYVGLGLGVARIEVEDTFQGQTIKADGTKMAYQAIAGVNYDATDNLGVGVDYRYYDTFKNLDLSTHSVNAVLRYRFG